MPSFSGTWKADLEKSQFLSAPPRAIFIQIDHAGDQIREEILLTRVDGTEDRVVFTCSTTGEEGHSTLNGKPIRGKTFWYDDELIVESWMSFEDRKLYFRDCWSLSEDGQTLTMEHRNDALAGQRTVLERMAQQNLTVTQANVETTGTVT